MSTRIGILNLPEPGSMPPKKLRRALRELQLACAPGDGTAAELGVLESAFGSGAGAQPERGQGVLAEQRVQPLERRAQLGDARDRHNLLPLLALLARAAPPLSVPPPWLCAPPVVVLSPSPTSEFRGSLC